ncbi:Clavaminate synthase-like protein [Metschnikowia bicuspidata]|uniref:Clavaminate synthase-like protein n=1 Tax=Metschnikowia bicuspidata TaxID=27322 RepID=A0A4P9ZFN4_9ASCO|nr:Clavaminate synthase-like protein [Metschnikowia bicuspidata]
MGLHFKISGSELYDPQDAGSVTKSVHNLLFTQDEYEETRRSLKYPEFLHHISPEEVETYENVANPDHFRNLFDGTNATLVDLSPNLGTEIDGIQLSQLNDAAKNDLALMLELRKLLVFHNQDLCDKRPVFEIDFDRYFGPLHIHPVAYSAKEYPEIFSTICKPGDGSCYDSIFKDKTGDFAWHLDVSLEEYPASFSFFVAIEAPPSGCDTVFRFFETLTVVHSNLYQHKAGQLRGLRLKFKNEKSLFFSRAFVQRISGLKTQESDAIVSFLKDHFTNNPEFQVRAMHKGTDSGTIIRRLQHTTGPRHHYRITVAGEKHYLEAEERESAAHERPKAY